MAQGQRLKVADFEYIQYLGHKKCSRCGRILDIRGGYYDGKGHYLCKLCMAEIHKRKEFITNF